MTQRQPTFSDRLVSAGQSLLRLLSDLYVRIRHQLALLVIDRGMRDTVAWYDRNHPAGTPRSRQQEENRDRDCARRISELEQRNHDTADRLTSERIRTRQLEERLSAMQTDMRRLSDSLSTEREQTARTQREARERERQLTEENASLTRRIDSLMNRCLPESEIPSMIYYAEGDTSGQWLRKPSPVPVNGRIYRMTTRPGNAGTADFIPELPADSDITYLIENRSLTLASCDITEIARTPRHIEVIAPGETMREGNRWKVVRKATIRLTD